MEWRFEVHTTVLRFSSFTTSTYYNSAALGLKTMLKAARRMNCVIVVTGASSSATLADLTGDEVVLGYITFTINNVPVGTYNDVASFKIDSLVAIGGYTFLESFDAYVTDAREVVSRTPNSSFWTPTRLLVPMALFPRLKLSIQRFWISPEKCKRLKLLDTLFIETQPGILKMEAMVMQGVECSVTSSAVLFVETGNLDINGVPGTQNACVAKVGKSNEAGAAGASVKLTSGDGLQFVVSYIRVWFPKVVSLEA